MPLKDAISPLVPHRLDELISKANQYFVDQRYEEALECYQTCVIKAPDDKNIHSNLATTLMQLGQLEAAKFHFDRSLSIDPNNPAALNNLAALLGRIGKNEEALQRLVELDRLTPNDPEVLSNIGVALSRLSREKEALVWFDRALSLSPKFSDALYGKSAALIETGEDQLAYVCCKLAIESKPQAAAPRLLKLILDIKLTYRDVDNDFQLGCSKAFFELEEWVDKNERNLRELGRIVGDRQLFELAYIPVNLSQVLTGFGKLMARAAFAYWQYRNLVPIQLPMKRSRIRIVVLNEQIRRHSVWDILLKGIVKHLDRSRFEIFLYHTGGHVDEETCWAKTVADKLLQGPKGHAEWLQQLRIDNPDVLFLPEIGMDPLTYKLSALRLAPLQVASWGHPVTTGLPEMDLYLSGELLEPEGADRHYCEKLIRLPGTGACTEQLPNIAIPRADDSSPQLHNRTSVKMVICQRPLKINPVFDDMLARMARVCWPCKIYILRDFKMEWMSDRVRDRLTQGFRTRNG